MGKFKQTKTQILFTILAIAVFCIWSYNRNRHMAQPKFSIDRIRADISPLNTTPENCPESISYYYDYFDLAPEKHIPGVTHTFGTFVSDGFSIAAHIYLPESPRATVVIMHGYLNHCGQLSHVIANLLENNYAVCAYDMPGHGLSTGKSAWADSFDKYAAVLEDFKPIVADRCPAPYNVMGFSHGSCPIIQTHLEGKENFFDKTILIAPLVRPVQWKKAQFCYRIYWPFRDSVPRIVRKNTSDRSFLKFNKSQDFLHRQRVPLIWVRALEKWNQKITALPTTENKLLIIQGDKDATVDFIYNTKFLTKKFNTRQITLKNAKHELLNESKEIKNKVFKEIISYLEDSTK